MINRIKQFISDERGASAIEYGLLAALIALMIIAGATLVGQKLNSTFNEVGAQLPDGTTQ